MVFQRTKNFVISDWIWNPLTQLWHLYRSHCRRSEKRLSSAHSILYSCVADALAAKIWRGGLCYPVPSYDMQHPTPLEELRTSSARLSVEANIGVSCKRSIFCWMNGNLSSCYPHGETSHRSVRAKLMKTWHHASKYLDHSIDSNASGGNHAISISTTIN